MDSDNNYLSEALRAAECGCWVWQISENILSWDDSLFKLYGVQKGSFSNNFEAWAATVHPDDLEATKRLLEQAVQGMAKFDTVFRIVKGSEKITRWIGARAIFRKDSSGKAVLAIGVNWDCTEEQLLRLQIQHRGRFIGNILDSLIDPICVYTENNEVVFTNVAFTTFFEVSQCSLTETFVSGELGALLNACFAKAKESKAFEFRFGEKDLHIKVTETTNPIDESRLKVLTFHDLTEKRQLEEKMIFSSKMASLGQMAGGIAHEINNPLTVARNSLYLVKRGISSCVALDPNLLKKFDEIDQGFDRAKKIVSALLTFSRSSGGSPSEKIKCKEVVEEVSLLAIDKVKRNDVRLKISCPEYIEILARKTDLCQAILNLVNNSCDACFGQDVREVRIDVELVQTQVRISVEDTGPGIPKELQEKILEPFFTTKAIGQGTGLGLSVSRELVIAMGGGLTLESLSPARFVISVPGVGRSFQKIS